MNMSIRFPHLGIDLGYVGKTVSVFGFELTIYGILVMAGMLLGLTVVVLQAKRQNQDQNLSGSTDSRSGVRRNLCQSMLYSTELETFCR